jgi:hypothetical protein
LHDACTLAFDVDEFARFQVEEQRTCAGAHCTVRAELGYVTQLG